MNQNPIIKALQEELAKDRAADAEKCGDNTSSDIADEGDEQTHFKNGVENGYKQGHEAATARLLSIVERALEVIEIYANELDWDGVNNPAYIQDRGKKAREFLTTLADASGEIDMRGDEITKLKEENFNLKVQFGRCKEELERLRK